MSVCLIESSCASKEGHDLKEFIAWADGVSLLLKTDPIDFPEHTKGVTGNPVMPCVLNWRIRWLIICNQVSVLM